MAQADLFIDTPEICSSQAYDLEGLTLNYSSSFLNRNEASSLFEILYEDLNWQQPDIRIAGREIPIPRKQVWFGDQAYQYTYSGKSFSAESWHPAIAKLKDKIEQHSQRKFNSALCNLYRDGHDSVSWHADDESELGSNPVIASFSLGETRRFQLRKKQDHKNRINLDLHDNSLLIMGPGVQTQWEHQVPKSAKQLRPRINITFRLII